MARGASRRAEVRVAVVGTGGVEDVPQVRSPAHRSAFPGYFPDATIGLLWVLIRVDHVVGQVGCVERWVIVERLPELSALWLLHQPSDLTDLVSMDCIPGFRQRAAPNWRDCRRQSR